jgi:hypothetical protein
MEHLHPTLKAIMKLKFSAGVILLCGILSYSFNTKAAVYVVTEIDQSPGQIEEPIYYQFNSIPGISANDLVNGLTPTIIGTVATASGGASKLTDGVGASAADSPSSNFFWDDYSANQKIIFDLGSLQAIAQVNSYSWHHGNGLRAPQDYSLFASTGTAIGFNPLDFNSPGWILLAAVNSEIPGGSSANAGQHGVSVGDTTGALGNFRYVGLNVNDPFGFESSFYSEIDVVAVPEPTSIALAGIGLLCVGLCRRK